MGWLRSILGGIMLTGYILSGLGVFIGFLAVLAPASKVLSPIITLFFVVIFTGKTFESRDTAVASVSALIMYTGSWFLIEPVGLMVAQAVCSVGIVLWFVSVFTPSAIHLFSSSLISEEGSTKQPSLC